MELATDGAWGISWICECLRVVVARATRVSAAIAEPLR